MYVALNLSSAKRPLQITTSNVRPICNLLTERQSLLGAQVAWYNTVSLRSERCVHSHFVICGYLTDAITFFFKKSLKLIYISWLQGLWVHTIPFYLMHWQILSPTTSGTYIELWILLYKFIWFVSLLSHLNFKATTTCRNCIAPCLESDNLCLRQIDDMFGWILL